MSSRAPRAAKYRPAHFASNGAVELSHTITSSKISDSRISRIFSGWSPRVTRQAVMPFTGSS
jgi:hypothetical protein